MIYVIVSADDGRQVPINKHSGGVVYHDYLIAQHWQPATYWGGGETEDEALELARMYCKEESK